MSMTLATTVETLELNKRSRIVLINSFYQDDEKGQIDFIAVLEKIKESMPLSFTDKILYLSSNGVYYLISLTSSLFLDEVECLNTNQQSKALKLLKKRIK